MELLPRERGSRAELVDERVPIVTDPRMVLPLELGFVVQAPRPGKEERDIEPGVGCGDSLVLGWRALSCPMLFGCWRSRLGRPFVVELRSLHRYGGGWAFIDVWWVAGTANPASLSIAVVDGELSWSVCAALRDCVVVLGGWVGCCYVVVTAQAHPFCLPFPAPLVVARGPFHVTAWKFSPRCIAVGVTGIDESQSRAAKW